MCVWYNFLKNKNKNMKKIAHYINILFNVSNHEWPRIILSWSLKMVVHAAFVMSSTILLALFVEEFGLNKLPVMYIISALFVVGGSVFFAFFLERFEKKKEIVGTTVLAAVLFLLSPFLNEFSTFFYGVMFIAISVFISQLNIILALFIEELFSPLESERTFPIIESSEPIGGILAGVILTFGVTKFHLSALDLLFYTAVLLLSVVPILFLFLKQTNKVPQLEENELGEESKNRFDRAKKGLRHIKGMPFLKGMLIVVLLHFTFVNLIEFQYTSVLDSSVQHEQESSHGGGNSHNSYAKKADSHNSHGDNSHGDGHSHADALTHGLAFWHVMFSIIAFLTQTISSSRIHKYFGVITSMRIHPLINFFSSILLLVKFGFATGIAGRGIFEVTTMMHRTTYHASFYSLKKSIREQVKEFMEGIIRPLGVIIGTTLLYLILFFVPEDLQHSVISALMIVIMVLMYIVLHKMQDSYTLVAKKNLNTRNSNMEKLKLLKF